MKKLFVIYKYFYPAYKAGGPIQSLKYLVEKIGVFYDVYVYTGAYDIDGTLLNVENDKWLKNDSCSIYYSSHLSSKEMKQFIKAVNPDILYLNSFFSPLSVYALHMLKLKKDNRIVIATRGEFAENALNIKRIKKNLYLRYFKLFFRPYDYYFHATNDIEKQNIEKQFGNKCVVSVLSNLHNVKLEEDNFNITEKESGYLKMVCLGRVVKMKNFDFLIRQLKKIRSHVVCDIYGAIEDSTYYEYCLEQAKELPNNISVNFKGAITFDKVLSTLSGYDVFCSPSLGENFGHAIFEALIVGLPILISDKIPFYREVTDFGAGYIVPLDQTDGFSNQIEELAIGDLKMFTTLKHNVYNYISFLDHKINDINGYVNLFG